MGLRNLLGLPESTTSDSDDDEVPNEEKYRIIAQDPDTNRAVEHPDDIDSGEWIFEQDPISKDQFQWKYGDSLDPGTKYVLVGMDRNGNPDFDSVEWSFTTDPPRRSADEDIQELKRELRNMQQSPSLMDSDDDVDDMIFKGIMSGQLDIGTAEKLVELQARLEQAKRAPQTDYFDSADPSNPQEVGIAALMNLTSEYDSLGDMMSDVGGGMLSSMDVGPTAGQQQLQQPQQQPQQQPPQQQPQQPQQTGSTASGGDDSSSVENLISDMDDSDDADTDTESVDDSAEDSVSVGDSDDQGEAPTDDTDDAPTSDDSAESASEPTAETQDTKPMAAAPNSENIEDSPDGDEQ